MADSTTYAPAWARPAAPDRHPLKRPVAPPLCRSHVHRPASTVRGHAGTQAAESTISAPILARPMPIYEYRCENGHVIEVMQKITDDPVTKCTECGAPVQRVFHPIAVHFKG